MAGCAVNRWHACHTVSGVGVPAVWWDNAQALEAKQLKRDAGLSTAAGTDAVRCFADRRSKEISEWLRKHEAVQFARSKVPNFSTFFCVTWCSSNAFEYVQLALFRGA